MPDALRRVTSLTRFLATAMLLTLNACGDAPALEGAPTADSDLIISRVMANPGAASDDRHEWVEIANLGADSTDLRGWRLRSAHDPGFTIARSLIVPPGGTVILGRSGDSLTNGGVHVDLVYTGVSLGNSGDWLVLRDPAGTTSDSVEWNVQQPGVVLDHRADHPKRSGPPRTTRPTSSRTALTKELALR